jgi:tetratricopeptide (TPR) repeat protein
LDGLPLAIAQAGAFLQESGTGIKAYLSFYEQQWSDLMGSTHMTEAPLQDYPERSVWTTWAISYQAIYEKHEHTAKLLLLWSFLDNKNLWYGLFEEANSFSEVVETILSRWIGKIATSELAFSQAMQLLRNYSLVEETKGATGYATHPVVHQWAFHYQAKQFEAELSQLAVIVVGAAVPDKERQDYSTLQRRLLPHAQVCSEWILREKEEQGNEITDGYKRSERCEKGLESTKERAIMFIAIGSVGNLYADYNKLVEAEHMFKKALQGKEKAFGPTHPLTLNTINNLGMIYRKQGKPVEAEHMYKQALQGYKEAFRPTYSSTQVTNNLAILYGVQGKLVEAEQMFKQVLQEKEKALGPTHLSTLHTINNLGVLCSKQGKLVEAEQMYKQALQGYEASGSSHLFAFNTISGLGNLCNKQGRPVEAEQFYQRALHGYKEALGDTQFRTYQPALSTMYKQGVLHGKQGDYTRAQKAFTSALSGYQAIFGPSHRKCLEISALIDECSAHLQAKSEESVSQLSIEPCIAGPSSEGDNEDELDYEYEEGNDGEMNNKGKGKKRTRSISSTQSTGKKSRRGL